jgi:hypothetical protein
MSEPSETENEAFLRIFAENDKQPEPEREGTHAVVAEEAKPPVKTDAPINQTESDGFVFMANKRERKLALKIEGDEAELTRLRSLLGSGAALQDTLDEISQAKAELAEMRKQAPAVVPRDEEQHAPLFGADPNEARLARLEADLNERVIRQSRSEIDRQFDDLAVEYPALKDENWRELIAQQMLSFRANGQNPTLAQVTAHFNETYPGTLIPQSQTVVPVKTAAPRKTAPPVLGSPATSGHAAKPNNAPLTRDEEDQEFLAIMARHGIS